MYNEILKLKEMLQNNGIPFEIDNMFGGYTIKYPSFEECVCSVIEHNGSYGHDDDKIEIMGLLTDEEYEEDTVVGWLTANDVFDRIKKHYEENKQKCFLERM